MVFRPARRTDRIMEHPEKFLSQYNWGVLSVIGEHGYPYGVPVNYGYSDGKIYIHSTSANSHKLNAIRENPKVCFTVVGQHEIIEEELTTQYSSVVLFGTARIITEDAEKRLAAERMMHVLAPAVEKKAISECGMMKNVVMIEITPDHISAMARK